MPTSAPGRTGPSAASRRGARLGAIVAVCAALVAFGVTGVGLLLPAAEPTPALRIAGAVLAIGAAGVLVRLEGAARGVTTLAVVSTASLLVCVATLPVSPVAHPWTGAPDPSSPLDAGPGGDGTSGDVVIEPGAPRAPGAGTDVLALPPGTDVVVEGDDVILALPDGGRITIGGTAVGGVGGPRQGGRVVVEGGTARVEGGDVLGPEVALGGTTFQRGDGSRAALGGGALLEVPDPVEQDAESTEGLDALLALLLACFALIAFAPPVVRFGERVGVSLLDEPEPEDARPTPAAPATVEEGLAGVLRAMLTDPDPRTAVIGAYARLLAALAEAGHPRRDEEGPHEHLWRTLGPLGVRRQPVHQLAELFVRARFTPRPVTEVDRSAAIAALADAVGDLRLQANDVADVFAGIGASA